MRLSRGTAYKLALNGLHYSGASRLLGSAFRGVGVLFTLHHVRPAASHPDFSPNRILDVTPEFLEQVIVRVAEAGYEAVSLNEFRRRIVDGDTRTPVVSYTLDDGYLDNYEHAYPVFARHGIPFTIYVCTGLVDGTARLWWRELEELIQRLPEIAIPNGEAGRQRLPTLTAAEKYQAFESLYWRLRAMPLDLQFATLDRLLDANRCERPAGLESALSWEMVKELGSSGLCTIGAHTVSHHALSKLPPEELQREIESSRELIRTHTGSLPMHFAYPYGDAGSAASREFEAARALGVETAVTTRKGVVFPEHAEHMLALPRVSLNGDYQRIRYLDTFLSGLPFAIHNRFRRCDVA